MGYYNDDDDEFDALVDEDEELYDDEELLDEQLAVDLSEDVIVDNDYLSTLDDEDYSVEDLDDVDLISVSPYLLGDENDDLDDWGDEDLDDIEDLEPELSEDDLEPEYDEDYLDLDEEELLN